MGGNQALEFRLGQRRGGFRRMEPGFSDARMRSPAPAVLIIVLTTTTLEVKSMQFTPRYPDWLS